MVTKIGLDQKGREKVVKLRQRWSRIVNDAKKSNLDTAADRKSKLDVLVEEFGRLGYPAKAARAQMKKFDALDRAKAIEAQLSQDNDEEVAEAFDKLSIALSSELPLFEELEEDDDEKVVDIKSGRTSEASPAA